MSYDLILDFSALGGDRIRLAGRDADATQAGDQAFVFASGSLDDWQAPAGTVVEVNLGYLGTLLLLHTGGPAVIDGLIFLPGTRDVAASDLVL